MIMKFLLVQINKRFSSYTRFIVHKYTFVGSDTLVTQVNDSRKLNITTKDCLKKLELLHIILYYYFKNFWITIISLTYILIQSTKESYTYAFNPVLFTFWTIKSISILPKRNIHCFISEFFAFNWFLYFYCYSDLKL